MMTNEERIQVLHARVATLQQQRERQKTGAIGATSVVLTVCLLFMVFNGGIHPGGTVGLYSGATMLFEGAGPYVLLAVVAFMAGVIVTVALIRSRKKETGPAANDRENTETDESGLHQKHELIQGRKS